MSETNITAEGARFIESAATKDLSAEALRIGRRCIVDTLGLYLAGGLEPTVQILAGDAVDTGGKAEAFVLSAGKAKVPAALAARVLGTAGHAHDWDDTQVSHDPAHIYGLLTHPSVPPLTAALVIAQRLGNVTGEQLMLAFQTGFEFECKISEWMLPKHYRRGNHSSGTVGTFGAAAAAAKLLGLKGDKLAHCIGMAASFAAGIRCNFGTMTKPLHVGRAAENGVTAALLAARGFTGITEILEAGYGGFLSSLSRTPNIARLTAGLGETWETLNTGFKMYPTVTSIHTALDALRQLMARHGLAAADIARVHVGIGHMTYVHCAWEYRPAGITAAQMNLFYGLAVTALRGQVSASDFTEDRLADPALMDFIARITAEEDAGLEAMGPAFRHACRMQVTTRDGRVLAQEILNRRGSPENAVTAAEVADKFRANLAGVLPPAQQDRVIALVQGFETLESTAELTTILGRDWSG